MHNSFITSVPASLIESAKQVIENSLYESLLLEDRIDFLKQKNKVISIEHDPMAKHKDASAIIDHITTHGDPTAKKIYSPWLVNQYKKGNFKQEDAYKLADHLQNFDKYKSKLEKKDINQYKTINDVANVVAPHIGSATTKSEEKAHIKNNLDMPGHTLKYDDDNISIYHLHDKAVSKKLYARKNDPHPGVIPTEWCTATENDGHNMFDGYLKSYPNSKYHVVHRKSDGSVFQYHADSNQFMDKNDNEISAEDFKSISPSLHKAWKQNPDLI